MFNIKKLACATIVMAAGMANLSATDYENTISGTIDGNSTVNTTDVAFGTLYTTADNNQNSSTTFTTNNPGGIKVKLTNSEYGTFRLLKKVSGTIVGELEYTVSSDLTASGVQGETAVLFNQYFVNLTTEGTISPILTFTVSAADAAAVEAGTYTNTLIYTVTLP